MHFIRVGPSQMYVLPKLSASAFVLVSLYSEVLGSLEISLRCLHSQPRFFSTPTYHILLTSKQEEA